MASSVHNITNNIPIELLIQLLTSGIWQSQRAIAQANRLARPADRTQALVALLPLLPPDQQPAVLAQALTAATAITDEYFRAQALTALAPHLPPDLLTAAVRVAVRTGGEAMAAVATRTAALAARGQVQLATALSVLREGLAQTRRSSCLKILGILGRQIRDIGGPQAVNACLDAIRLTAQWWP
jgi:hypothetical protein